MWKAFICIALPLSLASCISFTPGFDEELYTSITAVNEDLAKISAASEKLYPSGLPFSKVESYYIDASANLTRAMAVAEGRAGTHRKSLSARPAELIVLALKGCDAALQIQLNAHRNATLNRTTLAGFAADDACSYPAVMERGQKGA